MRCVGLVDGRECSLPAPGLKSFCAFLLTDGTTENGGTNSGSQEVERKSATALFLLTALWVEVQKVQGFLFAFLVRNSAEVLLDTCYVA